MLDGFKYEWDHVEIDDADEEEEDEEEVEAPDDDVAEPDLAGMYNAISGSNCPKDLELPDEEPKIPDGFALVADCPDITDVKKMLHTQVLFKWDCGWAQGVVKRKALRTLVSEVQLLRSVHRR